MVRDRFRGARAGSGCGTKRHVGRAGDLVESQGVAAGIVSVVSSSWCARLGGHGDQPQQVGGDGLRHGEGIGSVYTAKARADEGEHLGTGGISGPTPSITTGLK